MSDDALRALVALAKDPVMQKLRHYHIGWDDFAQQAFDYFRDLPALTAPDTGRENVERLVYAARQIMEPEGSATRRINGRGHVVSESDMDDLRDALWHFAAHPQEKNDE